MKEIAAVLASAGAPRPARVAARMAFLKKRTEIWDAIRAGRFPATYVSANGKKFTGAQRRTAMRCDFLLANKLALGPKYRRDLISDMAQRDLLFYVLRERERFPERTGDRFYRCAGCTSKLHECVSANVFRYIDNKKWKAAIEGS